MRSILGLGGLPQSLLTFFSLFDITEMIFESSLLWSDVALFAANHQWSKHYLMCQNLYSQIKHATDQWFYPSYI